MKKALAFFVVALCFVLSAKELKVLAIGNSFSASAVRTLPKLTASVSGCRLILTGASIGGCSLERHWNEWCKAEKDPKHAPYGISFWDTDNLAGKTNKRGNVNELIKNKNNKYDIITIQQNSANSWKYGTYQPYAENLIAVIKKYQPQAEIIIQQTWSYRADAPFFRETGMDNETMYQLLEKAYNALAKDYGFRMIPTGYAVQVSRELSETKFENYDWEMLDTLQWPDLPRQAGDVVGNFRWRKNVEGEMVIYRDTNHLNMRGEYLQAALWCGFLYDIDPEEIRYVAPKIGKTDAAFLRKCAKTALLEFLQ